MSSEEDRTFYRPNSMGLDALLAPYILSGIVELVNGPDNVMFPNNFQLDMSNALNRHNRVIVLNIGGEPSLTWAPPVDIVYYFANIRFAK